MAKSREKLEEKAETGPAAEGGADPGPADHYGPLPHALGALIDTNHMFDAMIETIVRGTKRLVDEAGLGTHDASDMAFEVAIRTYGFVA